MKIALQFLFVIISASAALAQTQIIVPGGLAETEGNSSSADIFRTTASTFQQVFSASEFAFLGAPAGRIDGISFRLDGETDQRVLGLRNISLILSTTTQSPDLLSPHFGDNAGSDAVEVYAGLFGINARSDLPGVQLFSITIPFRTPFFYDSSLGNLSMIFATAPGSTSIVLDAQLAAGDSVGRVFGDGINGTVDTLGLVTRFNITPVPEPSNLGFLLLSALLFSISCKSRAKRRFLRSRANEAN